MSILARYKKPGGFIQLLKLIETSQPVKQQKLLEAVEKEDPDWADLIRRKKLTVDMVLDWDKETQTKIYEYMNPRHCATFFKNNGGEDRVLEFREFFRLEKYNELFDLVEHIESLSPAEIFAAENNLLETIRFLEEEKKLILRFIDPSLDTSEAA